MYRTVLTLLLIGTLAACDSEPDPTFQKSVEDRQAAQAGDPYAALSRPPRLYSYSNAEAGQRLAVATSSAATLAATVQSMNEKMVTDKELLGDRKPDAQCGAAIKAGLAFQAGNDSGEAASRHAGEIFASLVQCREAAIEREKAADGGPANVEKRLASNAMALVGTSLIAKGDIENGLKLWREGDALIVKDKPSFKLEVKSLRGY